jgi:hypothetical protein
MNKFDQRVNEILNEGIWDAVKSVAKTSANVVKAGANLAGSGASKALTAAGAFNATAKNPGELVNYLRGGQNRDKSSIGVNNPPKKGETVVANLNHYNFDPVRKIVAFQQTRVEAKVMSNMDQKTGIYSIQLVDPSLRFVDSQMSGSRKIRLVNEADIASLQTASNPMQIFSEYQTLDVNKSPAVDTNMNNGWYLKVK